MLRKLLCLLLILFTLQPSALFRSAPIAHADNHSHLHSGNAALKQQSATSLAGRRNNSLWPGSRFTEAARARAVMRGLNFIYRTALKRRNFDDYGPDYIWCFYTLSVAVQDEGVRRAAHRMGLERARLWRHEHRFVPSDADAGLIS
ncbi:MAG TPA: hypothetical protein VGN95_13925, partial [Pyrinomonadaceae bacterium]|nr:hypothetical protein [Pyrinomonadaceae bacterium]